MFCFFYPIKKELYLGIKNFFYSKTQVDLNNIITNNYKRAQDNDNKFIVSGSNPIIIINLNNKYVENVEINFKERLQSNLQPKIYMVKEKMSVDDNDTNKDDTNEELIKIENIEVLEKELSYSSQINNVFKSLVFVIGKQIADTFVIDNISYRESYKYYWNEISKYNYLKQLKIKNYWLNVLKLFGIFILFVEYFVVRKKIYEKTGKRKWKK
ncbi:MAG: hypothetical protein IKN42_03185 [Elusimicrobia bacterium]|nr:hypothetical protein [Elusimicrobiota bacterium]